MTDTDLIARARQRDESAWETLVREHQQAAFRLAYLFLGDSDEASDVTQDAFIRAYRALARFDASRPFRPWLLAITANLARNRRRAAGRYMAALGRMVKVEPDLLRHAPAGGRREPDPAGSETLWRAARRLNTADQEVIYLPAGGN